MRYLIDDVDFRFRLSLLDGFVHIHNLFSIDSAIIYSMDSCSKAVELLSRGRQNVRRACPWAEDDLETSTSRNDKGRSLIVIC